jgi:hypothetical protein
MIKQTKQTPRRTRRRQIQRIDGCRFWYGAEEAHAWGIRAGATKPVEIELRGELTVAAASGDGKGPRRFSMLAYDGGPMRPKVDPPLPHAVVVDLASLDVSKQRYPALKDHDPKALVGHTDKVSTDGKLIAEGIISGTGAAATEVVASADNGFTWGVSMGAMFPKMELLAAGKSLQVNGRKVDGPLYIARKGRLRELSFLTLAADDDTAATIAAEAAEGEVMDFAAWLKANGFQPEDQLTDAQRFILRAQFKASKGVTLEAGARTQLQAMLDSADEDEEDSTKKGKKGKKATPFAVAAGRQKANGSADDGDDEADYASEMRAEVDAMRHERTVYRLCGEKHAAIAKEAIEKKWPEDMIAMKIEAAELRASMPHAMQIRTGRAKDAPSEGIVLEAACAITGRLDDLDKKFPEKALHEATERFPRGIGLQDVILTAAYANGYTGGGIRQDLRGVLQAAFDLKAAQFSTISLPGILSTTANRFLLAGYMQVDDSWRAISAIGSATNFFARTSYRLTGDGTFEEVPADGEIKHGTLGEESFENRLRTYAKMYGITRQDIINDDLGALTAIPRKLGRGAKLGLNRKFWDTFIANTTFFADPSESYLKGSTTNLSSVGLGLALNKWRAKTDADGEILASTPKILLVPPALEQAALELMRSTTFNTGGGATTAQVPNVNIWAGRFQVVVSDYLANETATTWYLLADPNDIPTIETLFLNGQQQPTIESSDADFNTLGVLMRGYFDFGCALADARGGLKVKGAA